jgi:cyclohexadieny/prephenate dehydrogenase
MLTEITILAPGLLGATVAMAVKERQLTKRISVWARRAETRTQCSHLPWCDQVFEHAQEAVASADLVVVCSPVQTIPALVSRIAPHLKPGGIVTDVGSTKNQICKHCHDVMPPENQFIGAHPIAGSEKTGHEHADPNLLKNKACLVTPLPETNPESIQKIVEFWTRIGMNVSILSPQEHDKIVACISHLPHLLATCLCNALARKDETWKQYAGTGLLDTTRIAAGSPDMWKGIIKHNREEILYAIGDLENELQRLKTAICKEQFSNILHILHSGKNYRDKLQK